MKLSDGIRKVLDKHIMFKDMYEVNILQYTEKLVNDLTIMCSNCVLNIDEDKE